MCNSSYIYIYFGKSSICPQNRQAQCHSTWGWWLTPLLPKNKTTKMQGNKKLKKNPVQFYKTRVFTLVTKKKKYFICCSFILRTEKTKQTHLHTHSNGDLCWCVMVKQVIILIILYGVSNRIFKITIAHMAGSRV